MANAISNHFCITALATGTSVQGSLRVEGTLSQNYNKNSGKCIPDWTVDANKPKVYAVVRKGAAYLANTAILAADGSAGGTWTYNDVVITFDSDGNSTNFTYGTGTPLFIKGTISKQLGGNTYDMPCLTINGNLASADNVDLDNIGFQGSVEDKGHQISFAASVDVRIAQMTTQGYLGLLTPESGIISSDTDTVTVQAKLYDESGNDTTTFYTKWYDGVGDAISGTNISTKSRTFTASEVTDNLVVRVDFFTDSECKTRVTTAFASIDDTHDPEFLYVSLDGKNSDYSLQLNEGESCTVKTWVATMEDSSAINKSYSTFTFALYNGAQTLTATITNASGGSTTAKIDDNNTVELKYDSNAATVTFTYANIVAMGYKLNGIVSAS